MTEHTLQRQPAATSSWTTIREALAGSHQDYTTGSLGRAIVLLAVPMVLEMAMESLFAVVDAFFVSRLGSDAVAAVGITESVMTLVYTVAMGLSIGVTAMVARRIGEGDRPGAALAAVQAVGLGLLVAGAIAAAGLPLVPRILQFMGASPEVVAGGTGYARTLLGGNAVIVLIFLLNAVFRGAGDPARAMRTLWIANGVNLVLDPCLIFGWGPFPELGLQGAAVATTIGRGVGVAYQLWHLFRPGDRVTVTRAQLSLRPAVMATLVRLSGTGTLQVFLGTASYIGMVRIVATFGSEVVAGYTIAIRLVIFALLPSWGFANAAATLVGQALGAQLPDRAERAARTAGWYNAAVLGGVGLAFVLLAGPLVSLFTSDPAVAAPATLALRVISAGFPFYAFGMVLAQSFNGAGDTWTPTLIQFVCSWLVEIPLAYTLALVLGWGPVGMFLAIAVGSTLFAPIGLWAFRKGRWKARSV
jgi:putative MATE family efflux protein